MATLCKRGENRLSFARWIAPPSKPTQNAIGQPSSGCYSGNGPRSSGRRGRERRSEQAASCGSSLVRCGVRGPPSGREPRISPTMSPSSAGSIASRVPSPFADLLSALAPALRKLGVRWFLFGAQAAIVHGAARLTADVDVTVELGEVSARALISALKDVGFVPRVKDASGFVERTRVLPVRHRPSGIDLDMVLAGPGPEQLFLARAVRRTIEGISVPVAGAEDLVAMKILAGRPKDLEDVVQVLAAQGRALRTARVRATLGSFQTALRRQDLLPTLEAALARVRRGSRSPLREGKQRRAPGPARARRRK
jgi:Nucleotidyl transferase AbiEii toxin, Type IV TA system